MNDTLENDEASKLNGIENNARNLKINSRIVYKKRDADVVDAVPTRDGILKFLQENNNDPDKSINGIKDEDHLKNDSKPSLCTVFSALFACRYLFERYSILDLAFNSGAIVLYLFDFITDWVNAFNAYYFRKDDEEQDYLFYFWLTVATITVPSLIMQAMSFWWEKEDNKEKKKQKLEMKFGFFYYTFLFLFHFLQIAPVYRYLRTIYYGLMSRYKEACGDEVKWKFYDDKYKGQLTDVNFVRLLESFLESAPQVVLQVYIMIKTVDVLPITVLSVCTSAFGMSSCFVTYQRALRSTLEDEKQQLSIMASIVLFVYRSFLNCSRVLALALLLNTNVWAWLFGLVGHWALMSVLIIWGKTSFCDTKLKEYLYDITIGFCYIFSYIHVHPDQYNSYRMLGYYSLTFIENTCIAVAWFHFRHGHSLMSELAGATHNGDDETLVSSEVALALMSTVVLSFLLGMAFFVVYYLFLHPKAPVEVCRSGVSETEGDRKSLTVHVTKHVIVTDGSDPEQREKLQLSVVRSSGVEMTAIRRLYVPRIRNTKSKPQV